VPRSSAQRQKTRRNKYWRYFERVHQHAIQLQRMAIYDRDNATHGALVGLLNDDGSLDGMGVIVQMQKGEWVVATPLESIAHINMIRIGSIKLVRPRELCDALILIRCRILQRKRKKRLTRKGNKTKLVSSSGERALWSLQLCCQIATSISLLDGCSPALRKRKFLECSSCRIISCHSC
jgi:polynucleotide 5'-kinase involved in rRNA processing